MIDYKTILTIVGNSEQDRFIHTDNHMRTAWSRDSQFIFFPAERPDYHEKISSLNAVQYLRRIRLLYTMLMKSN